MIDLHCHILPGLDDGPSDMAKSLAMCRMAAQDGITHVVATPHLGPVAYNVEASAIPQAVAQLQQALNKENIPLEIICGAEVNLAYDLVESARTNKLPFINNTDRYFSLELNEAQVSQGLEKMIFDLKLMGITPIITHPERTNSGGRDWTWLARLLELGCLSQITAMSLTGEFGRPLCKSCEELLEQNMVHFVATDAHSPDWRPPLLSEARARLEELMGPETAYDMLVAWPQDVLQGRSFESPAPRLRKRRWRLF